MPSNISGPLSDKPNGNTHLAHVANVCLPTGERTKRLPFLLQGLLTPVLSWLG